MNKQQLFENIKRKKSFLCVGLDTDIKKIPEHLLKEEDPSVLCFQIIVAYPFLYKCFKVRFLSDVPHFPPQSGGRCNLGYLRP